MSRGGGWRAPKRGRLRGCGGGVSYRPLRETETKRRRGAYGEHRGGRGRRTYDGVERSVRLTIR